MVRKSFRLNNFEVLVYIHRTDFRPNSFADKGCFMAPQGSGGWHIVFPVCPCVCPPSVTLYSTVHFSATCPTKFSR